MTAQTVEKRLWIVECTDRTLRPQLYVVRASSIRCAHAKGGELIGKHASFSTRMPRPDETQFVMNSQIVEAE